MTEMPGSGLLVSVVAVCRRSRIISFACALALAACGSDGVDAPPAAVPQESHAAASAFDREASSRFLAEAQAERAAGNLAAAEESYRAAALLWPDHIDAWEGLALAGEARGDVEAKAAAHFVRQRVFLFPTQSLATQREYRVALLSYIEQEETSDDANELQLAYARALADYYAYRYAERGTYQPPDTEYFDLRWEDVPAAALTGTLMLIYGFTIATS